MGESKKLHKKYSSFLIMDGSKLEKKIKEKNIHSASPY
jgi:hypothetical protein